MVYTDNNVPSSKFILNKTYKIKLRCIHQYPYNFECKKFNADYVDYGVDSLLRNIFYFYSGKNIYFIEPNFARINHYTNFFDYNKVDTISDAQIVYLAMPNGATLSWDYKINNLNDLYNLILKYDKKIFIIDFSYFVYTDLCKNYEYFTNCVKKLRHLKNVFVLWGASKMLGLPGLRVGFCATKINIDGINSYFNITAMSAFLINKLFNNKNIDKHVKIIKKTKKYLLNKYKSNIVFDTQGPFLALDTEINLKTRKFEKYHRLSIIDKKLIKFFL